MRRVLLVLALLGVPLCLATVFWLSKAETPLSFSQRRAQFHTKVIRDPRGIAHERPAPGTPGVFELVQYASSSGPLWAYVSAPGGERRPAMVWATGGFSNSIDDESLMVGPPDNDQSASAFHEAGIVLVKPSFRGGNDNPGRYEELYGEVDDFLAAVEYTRALPYVDPERVYIGGHSTGGTLVFLAAALSDRFRAGFAFGPVGSPVAYGEALAPFDPVGISAQREWEMRSPILFVGEVRRPLFLFEGTEGNAESLLRLVKVAREVQAPIQGFVLPWGDHFSILQPMTRRVAQLIVADIGERPAFSFGPATLVAP